MNEVRLINANVLKKAVIKNFDNLQAYFPKDFIEEIDNAPTVKQPHGEWIEKKLRNDIVVKYAFKCSKCKQDNGLYYRTNFCPNCGAKMKND